ncbi:hypothetical protein Tco_1397666, partial [Tanacetum coccineum]
YAGVFERIAGAYDVTLHGAYNLPGYAQLQYDLYYQQYYLKQEQQTHEQPDDDDDEEEEDDE